MQTFYLPPTEAEPCCPKCGARRYTNIDRSISIHKAITIITARCSDCSHTFNYTRNLPHHEAPLATGEPRDE